MINKVYICGYSLNLDTNSSIDDFEVSLEMLDHFLKAVPNYNTKLVNNDLLEFRMGQVTLDEILIEISSYSDPDYVELLKKLNESIFRYRSDVLTQTAIEESIHAENHNGQFVAFYSQRKLIPSVSQSIQVSCDQSLYNLNYSNLAKFPVSASSFTARAKQLFNNISFHKDFETTLSTVKTGDFRAYSIEFARALIALHSAKPKLSIGDPLPDLTLIREETSYTGNTMDCTRQGKNKKNLFTDFELKDSDDEAVTVENLNCEFHLKIDFDNSGRRVHKDYYNRAYFGLPVIKNKRYVALLHLGCHYE